MDLNFFLLNNKSGFKTKEAWFKKNYPDEYLDILDYSKNIDCSFKERIWFYFNKTIERPKCFNCKNELKFNERFDNPYSEFCSIQCFNSNKEEMIKRQVKTFNEKYGVDFYPKCSDFIKKQKITKHQRYGNENYVNVDKIKETKKKRYGNENYTNIEKYKITCISKYNTDNYSKSNHYKEIINKKYSELYPNINFIEINKSFVKIHCHKCNSNYEISKQLIYERNLRNYEICINCNPIDVSKRSGYEDEIIQFLIKNNIEIIKNYKFNNSKKEIDIFLPKYNLGIEFNGLYWHSELFKSSTYHLDKTVLSKNENIDLLHIFEDEWIYKKEIVKSIILNKLGILTEKINARNCVIKEVSYNDSKDFLEKNHIQGNVKSSIRLGLYFENELVSLITFSKGRIIMGGKSDEFELNRFCNKLNTIVVGGFSKLFKFFTKNYKFNKIISYSDIRYFNGGIYLKNGFKFIHQTNPNYWYIVGDLRMHRFNFNKRKLISMGYDSNKTEKEIMIERKIYRIYDCGNIRWEYDLQ
jgi:hypothetical protein